MGFIKRIGCVLLILTVITSCGKTGRQNPVATEGIHQKSAKLKARIAMHPECLDRDAVFEDKAQTEICRALRFDVQQDALAHKALAVAGVIESRFRQDEVTKAFEVNVIEADIKHMDDPGFIHLAVIIPKAKAQLMLNNMKMAREFGEETAKMLSDWMLQNGWKPDELGLYPQNLGGDPRVKVRLAFIHTYDTPTFFGQTYFNDRLNQYVWTNKPIGENDPILKQK